MRLILVRHGQTNCNVENVWHGWDDCELTAEGQLQAEAVATRLTGEPIEAVYSSDSRRALQTAAAIAAPHGLHPVPDAGLRERHAGDGADEGEERTRIDGPTVMLKPDVAQAIAVALHELATNAAKYGALSGAKGEVHVKWSCAADDRVMLRWTEAAGPPVNPPTHKGFGTDVIGAMIRAHVGGDMRLDWRTEGLVCEIALPT